MLSKALFKIKQICFPSEKSYENMIDTSVTIMERVVLEFGDALQVGKRPYIITAYVNTRLELPCTTGTPAVG